MAGEWEDSLRETLALAPILKYHPAVATAIAQTPGLSSGDVEAIGGSQDGASWANYLNTLSLERRNEAWSTMTPAQRDLAQHGGFVPASALTQMTGVPSGQQDGGGGFWSGVRGVLGGAAHGIKTAGSWGLHALDVPLDYVQHGERALMDYGQNLTNPATIGAMSTDVSGFAALGSVLSHPSDLARAWRETRDGESSYDRAALAAVQPHYDNTMFQTAKRVAEGQDLNALMASARTQEEHDLYQSYSLNPLFQEAINSINNTKLSLGRGIARALQINPVEHQRTFKYVSGLADAGTGLLTDPTLVGSKLANAARVARWGVGAIDEARIASLFDKTSAVSSRQPVRLYFQGALPHINALANRDASKVGEAFEQLQTNYRQILPMRDDLVEFARRQGRDLNVDDVKQFMVDNKRATNLMLGQAAKRGQIMPRRSMVAEHVGDKLRTAWRQSGPIAFFEKPSQTMEHAVGSALSDLEKADPMTAQGALFKDLRDSSRRYRVAMAISRLVEQDPTTKDGKLDLLASSASRTVYNLARMYLPRWHANQIAGAYEASDLGGRMLIYKGMLHSLGEAANVTQTEEGRQWLTEFVDGVEEAVGRGRNFSAVAGNDLASDGAQHAIHPHQMQTSVPMPSFREMHQLASRVGMTSHMGGFATAGMLDKFTSGWRPGVLLRPALAFRNALEEVTRHISVNGVWDFTKGVAVRHIIDSAAKEYGATGMKADITNRLHTGLGRLLSPEERRYVHEFSNNDQALTTYLEGIRDSNARGLTNLTTTDREADRRLRRGGREYQIRYRTDGKDFKLQDTLDGDGVRRWTGALRTLMQPGNTTSRVALANIEDHDEAIAALTDHILSEGFRRNRDYSRRYKLELGDNVRDPLAQQQSAQKWAEAIYKDVRAHVSDKDGNLLDDLINDIRVRQPDGSYGVNMAAITDKRLAQIQEARRPAAVVAGDVMYVQDRTKSGMLTAPIAWGFDAVGRLTGFLGKNNIYYANYLQARKASAEWEKQLADTLFWDLGERTNITASDPRVVAAMKVRQARQRLSQVEDDLTQHGAVEAGEAPDWAGAQIGDRAELEAEAAQLRKEIESAQAALVAPADRAFLRKVDKLRDRAEAAAKSQVTGQAARTAEMQTLAYVDNPDVRSQAAVLLRNVIPFYRAQEEFYRRWGRTFRHNPEAIRKIQLLHEGAVHSGVIEKDEEGNDIFIYPGSRNVQELMYQVGKGFGWNWAMSPVPYTMSSQIRFLNQGLDPKNIQPSLGPVAAVPIKALEKLFPESTALKQFNRTLLGDQAASQSNVLMQVLPTPIRRLYESGIFGNETEQLASGMKTGAIYLEAAGRTPPEGASAAEWDHYQDDLRKWTRVHLFMRAIFGTTAPAAPQELGAPRGAPIGDKGTESSDPGVYMGHHQLIDQFRKQMLPTVASEFRAEVARTGDYNTALANWIRTRPNELPFTVGTTEARYGGYIPATKAAGDFFDNNRDLFHSYPAAAVLFMPQAPGKFDMDVYRTELGAGLRDKKDFATFALDLKKAGAIQRYYDLKAKYDQQRGEAKAAGNNAQATEIDRQWKDVKERYLATYPSVQSYFNNYQERQSDVQRTMSELQTMVDNGHMPNVPGKQAIALIVDAYQKRQMALNAIGDARTDAATAQKNLIKSSFQDYVRQVAATDQNADMAYQRLFRGLDN